jgi:hypothetical protein
MHRCAYTVGSNKHHVSAQIAGGNQGEHTDSPYLGQVWLHKLNIEAKNTEHGKYLPANKI